MKAMIMAAGVGSRLMPMTIDIPKPMVPMVNRPLMENTINLLLKHGFADIVANLHYKHEVISSHFHDGSNWGVNLRYSLEEELLGTAGGVKKCESFLNETFVVVSGDALTDVDLSYLLREHRAKGSLATIALKEVDNVESFGIVVTDEDGLIQSFQEKPRRFEALSNTANTGIYIFEPEIFKHIPPRQFYDFGKQVFPRLVKIGAPFYGVAIDQYWCDIGDLLTYRQAHFDVAQGRVAADMNASTIYRDADAWVLGAQPVQIGSGVKWEGTVILGAGCRIEDNVSISNSVIWEGTAIGANTQIERAVIGNNCEIGRDCSLQSGTVVAGGCILENGTRTAPGTKLFRTVSGDLQLEQG